MDPGGSISGGEASGGEVIDADQFEVTDVLVERDHGLTLTFADGHVCRFALDEVRSGCPCATCRGWREQGQPAWPRPGSPAEIAVVDAELVGAWGISFRWNDGHDTGIYPWDALRRWCDERNAP
jgi:DUF971 family protein